MSDDDDSEKRKKKKVEKKKNLWQGANEEFFQESYPSGSGQDDAAKGGAGKAGAQKKKSSVRRFPSYAASTRRNGANASNVGGGGAGGGTTTITYAMQGRHGTFGRTITTNVGYSNATVGAGTIYDNTGVLPDLTDLSIPNEQKRWEEVQKIRSLPIPMSQKRQLKTQLTTIPMLKLKGWKLLRWKQLLCCHSLGRKWASLLACLTFWNSAIREVQVGRGTNISQLFQLIKWAFKLNFVMCVLVLIFILLPQLIILKPISKQLRKVDTSRCIGGSFLPTTVQVNRSELANCCTELYYENRRKLQQLENQILRNASIEYDNENGTITSRGSTEFEAILLKLSGGHGQYGRSEFSPLFYGFYYFHEQQVPQRWGNRSHFRDRDSNVTHIPAAQPQIGHDGSAIEDVLGSVSDFVVNYYSTSYSFIYLCTQLLILVISAWFIFRQVQLRTIIIETEDPGHKFSDLVFTGWEHNTRDAEAAKFKRKTIRHQMKLALKAEKYKIELRKRTRKMRWKLLGQRLLTSLILIVGHICLGFILFEMIGFGYEGSDTAGVVVIPEPMKNETVAVGDDESVDQVKLEIWLIVLKAFLPAITIVAINSIFPFILTQISRAEKFSQSITLRLTLWRVMFSRILLIVFLGVKLYWMTYCRTSESECSQCATSSKDKVRAQCWESLFGEQLYKIVLVDLTFKICIGFVFRPLRNCIGLYCPGKFFRHIGLMKFSVTMQSLDILYIQFLSWIGVYFAPFLPLLVLIYSFLLFYLNKLTVFVTCRGIPEVYKAMRLSTIYLYLKLVSFGVVGIAITIVLGYLEPSKSCGPFRQNSYPWDTFTKTVYTQSSGPIIATSLSYFSHPITILIAALLLCSIAYYYYTLTRYGRGTVSLLKNMLVLEGHDKQFLFARLNSLKRSSLNSSDSIPPLTRAHGTILNEDDD